MAGAKPQPIAIVAGSLAAILDKEPGRSALLLVVVDVELETDCAVELVAAVPQGINPLIKLLHLAVGAPCASAGGPRVRRTLRYEETPAGADYREVWLGEGQTAISAKVSLVM